MCWINEGFCALAVGDDKSTWGTGWVSGGGCSSIDAKNNALAECKKRAAGAHVVLCLSSDGQYIDEPQEPSPAKPQGATGGQPGSDAPPTGQTPSSQTITNEIGMQLVLIPAGEFTMGSRDSAEDTAAFFNKNYGEDQKADSFKDQHPQHQVRITRPFYLALTTSRAGNSGSSSPMPTTKRTPKRAPSPGPSDGTTHTSSTKSIPAKPRFRPDRRTSRGQCKLERCGGLLPVAKPEGRPDLSPADRGRVGIRLPRRQQDAV